MSVNAKTQAFGGRHGGSSMDLPSTPPSWLSSLRPPMPMPVRPSPTIGIETGLSSENSESLIDTSRLRDAIASMSPAGTNSNGDPYDYLVRNTATLRATLKQPLSRGFGPKVALAPITKADLTASDLTIK